MAYFPAITLFPGEQATFNFGSNPLLLTEELAIESIIPLSQPTPSIVKGFFPAAAKVLDTFFTV